MNSKSTEIFIKDTEWYIMHSSLADCTNTKCYVTFLCYGVISENIYILDNY